MLTKAGHATRSRKKLFARTKLLKRNNKQQPQRPSGWNHLKQDRAMNAQNWRTVIAEHKEQQQEPAQKTSDPELKGATATRLVREDVQLFEDWTQLHSTVMSVFHALQLDLVSDEKMVFSDSENLREETTDSSINVTELPDHKQGTTSIFAYSYF